MALVEREGGLRCEAHTAMWRHEMLALVVVDAPVEILDIRSVLVLLVHRTTLIGGQDLQLPVNQFMLVEHLARA